MQNNMGPYEFSGLLLHNTGKQKCPPRHSFSWQLSNGYLLHYVIDGKGTLKLNGNTYEIGKGSAFLISNRLGIYEADEKEPWTYEWARFSGIIAERFLESVGLDNENPIYKTLNPQRVEKSFDELLAVTTTDYYTVYGRLLSLFGEILNTSAKTNIKATHINYEYVDKCLEFIHLNYYRSISAGTLAGVVGLEYSYLFRLFKEQLGISPGEYIIKYKLLKSEQLLLESDMNINEISAAVGYDDRVAFSKLFKSRNGVSPRKYRNDNAEKNHT